MTAVVAGARLDLTAVRRGHGFGNYRKNSIGPFGRVEFVGVCGHPPCPHGDQCVTVRWDGAHTTVNYSVADLEDAVVA